MAHSVNADSPHLVPTCEKQCVNCGVCTNFKTHKVLAKPFVASDKAQELAKQEKVDPSLAPAVVRETFKYRIKLTKTGILKYFSHLDWQNTFFKALARTDLNVAFSLGFNPSMKVSMGVALPLFAESITELVDIELYDDLSVEDVQLKLEKVLPVQSQIISIVKLEKKAKAIDNTVFWAEYRVEISDPTLYDFDKLVYNTNKVLSSDEIYIEKKNKKGLIKKTNIKSSVKSYRFEDSCLFIVLRTGQGTWEDPQLPQIPALRADVLMNVIAEGVPFNIVRVKFFDESLEEL